MNPFCHQTALGFLPNALRKPLTFADDHPCPRSLQRGPFTTLRSVVVDATTHTVVSFCLLQLTTMNKPKSAKQPPRKKVDTNLSAEDFNGLAADLMNRSAEGSELTMDVRFRSMFGVSAVVCAIVWTHLCQEDILPVDCVATYLLWALMFLKTYDTEKNLSGIAGGVDEKTYVKWTWIVLDGIALLEYKIVSIDCIYCVFYSMVIGALSHLF